MAKFSLTAGARANLNEIAVYTETRWSKAQAHAYLNGLTLHFRQLAEQPLIGRSRSELGEGLRSFPFESHIIYYRLDDLGISIVRVLHKRQLPTRHMKD